MSHWIKQIQILHDNNANHVRHAVLQPRGTKAS